APRVPRRRRARRSRPWPRFRGHESARHNCRCAPEIGELQVLPLCTAVFRRSSGTLASAPTFFIPPLVGRLAHFLGFIPPPRGEVRRRLGRRRGGGKRLTPPGRRALLGVYPPHQGEGLRKSADLPTRGRDAALGFHSYDDADASRCLRSEGLLCLPS